MSEGEAKVAADGMLACVEGGGAWAPPGEAKAAFGLTARVLADVLLEMSAEDRLAVVLRLADGLRRAAEAGRVFDQIKRGAKEVRGVNVLGMPECPPEILADRTREAVRDLLWHELEGMAPGVTYAVRLERRDLADRLTYEPLAYISLHVVRLPDPLTPGERPRS